MVASGGRRPGRWHGHAAFSGQSRARGHALEEDAQAPIFCRAYQDTPELRHADGTNENQDVKASQEIRPEPLPHGQQDGAAQARPAAMGMTPRHAAISPRTPRGLPPLLPRMHARPGRDPDRAGSKVKAASWTGQRFPPRPEPVHTCVDCRPGGDNLSPTDRAQDAAQTPGLYGSFLAIWSHTGPSTPAGGRHQSSKTSDTSEAVYARRKEQCPFDKEQGKSV